jgi:hypothetical protein
MMYLEQQGSRGGAAGLTTAMGSTQQKVIVNGAAAYSTASAVMPATRGSLPCVRGVLYSSPTALMCSSVVGACWLLLPALRTTAYNPACSSLCRRCHVHHLPLCTALSWLLWPCLCQLSAPVLTNASRCLFC